jgi:AraC-like DNA-binding protein
VEYLANIAVELERALEQRAVTGASGHLEMRAIAGGDGWIVQDVVCTSGPSDRPFQERHAGTTIAIVVAGSFQYRGSAGRELMTPGSLVLGNTDQAFECGHEHGSGDRCISFWYAPEYFERLRADAGSRTTKKTFRMLRLPPLRETSFVVARACAGLADQGGPSSMSGGLSSDTGGLSWEDLSLRLAVLAVQLDQGLPPGGASAPPSSVSRVTRVVRKIERQPDASLSLGSLAEEAGLSPYHFLRTFERLTGLTPHQYILRTRLREAATRLAIQPARVIDIALDCGFGDVSNFNRSFRAEFGVSPRVFRRQAGGWTRCSGESRPD